MSSSAGARPTNLNEVPGWFNWLDQRLFSLVLQGQEDEPVGELVELGAYLGKSAVLIGDHLREQERFVVVDLFGDELGVDSDNLRENRRSYGSLTRDAFERNYSTFHPSLPVVVQGPSAEVVTHVDDGKARFIHVDASHLYEHVRGDVASARRLLRPGGVVVFDDYRSEHTPGVAAAVWEAVANDGLVPFALSTRKLYATFDSSSDKHLEHIRGFVHATDGVTADEHTIRGTIALRLRVKGKKPKPKQNGPKRRANALSKDELDELAESIAARLNGNLPAPRERWTERVRRRASRIGIR